MASSSVSSQTLPSQAERSCALADMGAESSAMRHRRTPKRLATLPAAHVPDGASRMVRHAVRRVPFNAPVRDGNRIAEKTWPPGGCSTRAGIGGSTERRVNLFPAGPETHPRDGVPDRAGRCAGRRFFSPPRRHETGRIRLRARMVLQNLARPASAIGMASALSDIGAVIIVPDNDGHCARPNSCAAARNRQCQGDGLISFCAIIRVGLDLEFGFGPCAATLSKSPRGAAGRNHIAALEQLIVGALHRRP